MENTFKYHEYQKMKVIGNRCVDCTCDCNYGKHYFAKNTEVEIISQYAKEEVGNVYDVRNKSGDEYYIYEEDLEEIESEQY